MSARDRAEVCGLWPRAAGSGPYGSKCARKHAQSHAEGRTGAGGLQVPPALSQALTARNTPSRCEGQAELPLTYRQVTLWSL